MLRELLTARPYDAGEAYIADVIPFKQELLFISGLARVLLKRDAISSRKRERGEGVLAELEIQKQEAGRREAKRSCVADAMSQRMETADAVSSLAEMHGTAKALGRQAGLWGVTVGKTKATTSSRIIAAIEASQEQEKADEADESEEENEENELHGFV